MPLSKCPRCKSIWNRTPEATVCDACVPDEEADREKVLECIANNPGMNADQIAEITEVEVEAIRRMLDDGTISREVDLDWPACGQCGAPALSHSQQLCEKCLAELDKETMERRRTLQSAINDTKFGDRGDDIVGEDKSEESISARELLNKKRQ